LRAATIALLQSIGLGNKPMEAQIDGEAVGGHQAKHMDLQIRAREANAVAHAFPHRGVCVSIIFIISSTVPSRWQDRGGRFRPENLRGPGGR